MTHVVVAAETAVTTTQPLEQLVDNTTDGRLRQAVTQLVVAHDGDEFMLGRPDLGVYVAVPEPGAVFITALQQGSSMADATAQASQAAGEDVDVEDFLSGLAEVGLLDEPATTAEAGRRIRWIEGVKPATARRLFGRIGWAGYGLATLFACVVLVTRADLRPAFEDLYFLGDPVLSLLVFFPIGLVLGAAHEAWHWLAGRALDVPAVFRVSRRGIFVVFETDLTQIVVLPRRKRYGAFLAGMAFDCTVLAIALAMRLCYRIDLLAVPPVIDRLLGVVVLTQLIAVAWQAIGVFLRSDLYAVLANLLRCHNLYRATWLTVKDRLWRLTPADAAEFDDVSPHDRQVARWFALVYVAGVIGVGWLAVGFGLPTVIGLVTWLVSNLAGLPVDSITFWESVAVLAATLVQWIALPLLGIRERRMREAGKLL